MNMHKQLILACAALTLACGATAQRSYKRGLAEGSFSNRAEMDALAPGTTWFYNWANTPNAGTNNEVINNDDWDFCPMAWNENWSEDRVRQYVKAHPQTKYFLGYNEPNFHDQAEMTPEEAAKDWPRVQAICNELGLKIVSPATNNSAWAEWSDPVKWMREFIKLVGIDAVDYIAFHAYGGMANITDTATRMWEEFHKPLWLTEFCYWPGGAGSVYVSPEQQMKSMITMVKWCEKTDYIYRYAWFQAHEKKHFSAGSDHRCPNYFLLELERYKDENGKTKTRFVPNERGYVYAYMSTYDPDVYFNADGTLYNAVDAADHENVAMGKSTCTEISKPIELTNISNGAIIDYQFDVPSTDDYTLTLLASGYGEPTRFDPELSLVLLNADGSEGKELCPVRKFTLPNDDNIYREYYLPCALTAGRQTLRVKGAGLPSGMRIAGVKLDLTAGIENVTADDNGTTATAPDVYDIAGRIVRSGVAAEDATEGLPAGIYIVDGKKLVVR